VNPKPAAGVLSANLRSIFFMMLASACFSSNDICTKIAVQFLPAPEIIVFRGATAFVFAFALVCFVHGASQLKALANRNVAWRSVFEGSVGPMIITCYAFLPLATVTAVMQVGPFLGMIAGIYIFKESVGWRRWCAALIAFLGVLFIVKPGADAFQPIAVLVLLIAAVGVGRDIQSRRIGNSAPPFVVSLATSLTGTTIALLLTPLMQPLGIKAWGPWVWPDLYSFALCCLAGLLMVLANTFSFLAFRSGDMSVVAPFRYFYLFFAVIGGVIVFTEIPDVFSLTGMALIVAAGIYLLHRERLRARHKIATQTQPAAQ
jgi:drug/metabolite transporter (DMT)-like permease